MLHSTALPSLCPCILQLAELLSFVLTCQNWSCRTIENMAHWILENELGGVQAPAQAQADGQAAAAANRDLPQLFSKAAQNMDISLLLGEQPLTVGAVEGATMGSLDEPLQALRVLKE